MVADSTWAAIQGREALEIEWDHGPHAKESSQTLREQFESLAQKPGKVVRHDGDALTTLEKAGKRVEAVYELPFLAHATMEPMNCTADVRADRVEVWAPTQAPDWALAVTAGTTRVPRENVVVHTTFMGGGFGGATRLTLWLRRSRSRKRWANPSRSCGRAKTICNMTSSARRHIIA